MDPVFKIEDSTDTRRPAEIMIFSPPQASGAACSDTDLERLLERLAKYGHPTLMRSSRGWWCYLDLHVTAVGAKFEIKSESNHATPREAAAECESRLGAALRSIGAV